MSSQYSLGTGVSLLSNCAQKIKVYFNEALSWLKSKSSRNVPSSPWSSMGAKLDIGSWLAAKFSGGWPARYHFPITGQGPLYVDMKVPISTHVIHIRSSYRYLSSKRMLAETTNRLVKMAREFLFNNIRADTTSMEIVFWSAYQPTENLDVFVVQLRQRIHLWASLSAHQCLITGA